jgi:hypothetical protein
MPLRLAQGLLHAREPVKRGGAQRSCLGPLEEHWVDRGDQMSLLIFLMLEADGFFDEQLPSQVAQGDLSVL